ncbi:MAG: FAD:protein FMN transferase [Eubacteriales bacterium]|nr:FAD:protein FMN transferase [Eubacteriales bacterium]
MRRKEKNKKWKVLAAWGLLVFLTGCAGGGLSSKTRQEPGSSTTKEERFSKTDFVMDTVLQMTIYGRTDYSDEIKEKLSAAETEELSWRQADSEVFLLNQRCSEGETVEMTEAFSGWAEASLSLAQKSGGAFDPTIGNLTRLWDVEGENPTVPDKSEIQAVMESVGYEAINIEGEQPQGGRRRISMKDGVTLDLGAVGKGIGCDIAGEILGGKRDVQGAVIAVGGSILTYGSKPGGEPWSVAIRDPEGAEGEYVGVIKLEGNAFVSTSGDYEKFFVEDGKKYHHIMDPSTGYPSESDVSSVTVVCVPGKTKGKYPGLLSDGLSTACFVLGTEKGKALLEEYGAEGVLIDKENNVTVTDGLAGSLELF